MSTTAGNVFSPYAGYGAMIGGGLGSMFAQNPANSAMQYYNQIPGQLNNAFGPYMQNGQWAGNQLQGQIGNLLKNPTGFVNNMYGAYQGSPAYNWNVQQATLGANNAAAAGGMAGSPAEQQSLAQTISGIANQYQQQYVQNAMNAYGLGFGGAQNMYGVGANAAGQYGNDMAQTLSGQGQTAYAGAVNQNQSMGGGLGSILGGVGGLLGKFL